MDKNNTNTADDKRLEYQRQYHQKYRKANKERYRQYRIKRKDKTDAYNKEYQQKHSEAIRENRVERYKKDPTLELKRNASYRKARSLEAVS